MESEHKGEEGEPRKVAAAMAYQHEFRRLDFTFRSPALAMAILISLATGAWVSAAERPQPRVATHYAERLLEVRQLAVPQELDLLASLKSDDERERFLSQFWLARGVASKQRMRENRRDADRLVLRAPGQSTVILLAGKPTRIHRYEACESVVRRLEVWQYEPWRVDRQRAMSRPLEAQDSGVSGASADDAEASGSDAVAAKTVFLVFVQRTNLDPRSFELWDREADSDRLVFGDGRGVAPSDLVREAVTLGCVNHEQSANLRRALENGLNEQSIAREFGWTQPSAWWERDQPLNSGSLSPELLDGGAQDGEFFLVGDSERSLASVTLEPAGAFFRHTLMNGLVMIPAEFLHTLDGAELFDRVEILGDVFKGDRLIDGFRIVHHVAGDAPPESVKLDFYRRLLPGQYRLELRVENAAGLTLVRETRALEVPKLEERASQPPGRRRDVNRLTRADVVFLTTSPSLEIIPPEAFPVAGPVTVEAVARGGRITQVEFVREDGTASLASSPPFLADVKMSKSRVRLAAHGKGEGGQVLTSDSITLRRDARPFRVWFDGTTEGGVEGVTEGDQHLVRVQIPEEEVLVSVRCYQNGEQVASFDGLALTLAVSDFHCPQQPPQAVSSRPRFDRVVARLESGEEVEDLVFLSQAPESLDIRLVELFVSVLDAQGRPVSGLQGSQFQVLEDGRPQSIERVNAVERLPLSISVMLDTSSSMGRRVRLAVKSTQSFFKQLMRDGDVASLFAFQHDLLPLVDFTGDGRELEYAAQGLRGSGGTRLHDGLIYNLHSFAGLPARRALVVLSDGADTESDTTAQEALEAAQRSGVLVFPVALGEIGEATEQELRTLAAETGGAFFAVSGVAGLDGVYRDIERILRSQYQVVYRPKGEAQGHGYQQVEIRLSQPGLSVRNVRGYYR